MKLLPLTHNMNSFSSSSVSLSSVLIYAIISVTTFSRGALAVRLIPSGERLESQTTTSSDTLLREWFPGHFDTVSDALSMNPFLSLLKRALNASSLFKDLDDLSATNTILAPTNQAFSDLLKRLDMTERELFADSELLSKILRHHIIPRVVLKLDDLHDGQVLETMLEDQPCTFYRE